MNISVLTSEAPEFDPEAWATGGVSVSIDYTDLNGKQALTSRAVIKQFATQSPFIEEVLVLSDGEVIAVGRGSY